MLLLTVLLGYMTALLEYQNQEDLYSIILMHLYCSFGLWSKPDGITGKLEKELPS